MENFKECFIVGGGASLKKFQWSDLQGKFVIAINRSYEVLPDAQIVYFTDNNFWLSHKDAILKHKGRKIKGSLSNSKINDPHVEEFILTGQNGFEHTPGQLRHGKNSTFAAINLAAQLGFKKIYLLGIDMKWGKKGDKNTTHWHSGHSNRVPIENGYKSMVECFPTIIPTLKQLGVEVFNVNFQDGLKGVFPLLKFSEVFGPEYEPIEQKILSSIQVEQQPKLLGDQVESALQAIGVKKVMDVYQRITKKPCNCGKRKQLLNDIHQRLIDNNQKLVQPLKKPKP